MQKFNGPRASLLIDRELHLQNITSANSTYTLANLVFGLLEEYGLRVSPWIDDQESDQSESRASILCGPENAFIDNCAVLFTHTKHNDEINVCFMGEKVFVRRPGSSGRGEEQRFEENLRVAGNKFIDAFEKMLSITSTRQVNEKPPQKPSDSLVADATSDSFYFAVEVEAEAKNKTQKGVIAETVSNLRALLKNFIR